MTPSQCSGTALTQMQESTRGENDGNMKRKRICLQQMISNMITVLYKSNPKSLAVVVGKLNSILCFMSSDMAIECE